jgi:peptidoglycan hydrolase-like protein with peptidoglycan-binding domain
MLPADPALAAPVTTAAAPSTTATPPATTAPTVPAVPAPSPAPVAPTPTTTVPADGRLLPGMQGDAVRALQERLVSLHYDPGKVDGRYGAGLVSAVMAFQKVSGMPRNGRATPDVLAAVAAATDPPPMLPDGGAARVEIDFKRQVLFHWRDGALLRILPVSTGNGKRYCAEGICGVAVTPSGSYRIERRQQGKRKSYLGLLYDPLYFKGGYAIHGSPSVPAYPASHGCVRIPLHVSRWFFDNVPNRTPVYLIGGRNPATPLPPEPPPAPPPPEPAPPPA